MQTIPPALRPIESLPEIRSALLKVREQAELMMDDRLDRGAQDRLLLIIALARFCLASLPAKPAAR